MARRADGSRRATSAAPSDPAIAAPRATPCPLFLRPADQVIYIIQEVLTNIRKHAQAELVEIRLELVGDKFQVEIQDNGIGFDPSKAGEDQDWRHFGMLIMQERAAAAGGMVEVDSQPGQGTRVRLSVPVRDIEVWNPTKGEAKK